MIGYLKGVCIESREGRLLVGVGPSSSSLVGYLVSVPQGPDYIGCTVGAPIELFIYSHVREDAFDLYGFRSSAEKELFLSLLSVNGVGPKVALSVLSSVNPDDLISAILNGDKDALVRVPGVGKKTAERLVLELGDHLKKKVEAGAFGNGASAFSRRVGKTELGGESVRQEFLREAKEALIGLGYRDHEVGGVLNRVMEEKRFERVEDLIRSALQRLG